jgi:large subunit ribosomal protein L25
MILLEAKIREKTGRKIEQIKQAGRIPAVVYGHKVKNINIDVDCKEFLKVFKGAGESSLFELLIDGEKDKRPVLIHEIQKNPVSDEIIHIDFFQASLKEEVEVDVPLVFEGTSLAVKELGGTLVKSIPELKIKALPQNLPHEIKVFIDRLKTFEDHILVKDLVLPQGVKVLISPDEIVASVAPLTNVEEELAKEIEEKVEDVEKVEKEKKEEDIVEDGDSEKTEEK